MEPSFGICLDVTMKSPVGINMGNSILWANRNSFPRVYAAQITSPSAKSQLELKLDSIQHPRKARPSASQRLREHSDTTASRGDISWRRQPSVKPPRSGSQISPRRRLFTSRTRRYRSWSWAPYFRRRQGLRESLFALQDGHLWGEQRTLFTYHMLLIIIIMA